MVLLPCKKNISELGFPGGSLWGQLCKEFLLTGWPSLSFPVCLKERSGLQVSQVVCITHVKPNWWHCVGKDAEVVFGLARKTSSDFLAAPSGELGTGE